MLGPMDEFPVHQIPQPIAWPGSSDRNFYDRSYFNAHDRSGDIFVISGIGYYPNLGVKDAFLLVRRGDEQWANIVRWTVQAMLAAEALDLRRDNVQSERRSNDPDVQHLLGVTPGNGKALGLDEDWAFNIILQVGNYGESFERNLGQSTPLKIQRGLNALWKNGGLMYNPPFR